MKRTLTASARALGEIFGSGRRYRIPFFQRPYAWSSEEAGALLSDIKSAQADAADRLDETPPYFLGSMVLVSAVGDDRWMMVDGQQRLTTLTMMLSVLRDLDEDGEERLGRFVLAPDDAGRGPQASVLSPRPLDLEYFYENFQRPGATQQISEETRVDNDAQAMMLEVALNIRADLEKMRAPARIWLAEFILRCCTMVEVSAPYEDQAYKVFMVMNARGKDLRDNDLLKAEVLGHIAPQRQGLFGNQWERLEADLGAANFVQLFKHIRMIHRPGRSTKTTAVEIREALNPAQDPEGFITHELVPKGKIMRELLEETIVRGGPLGAKAGTLLRSLKRLNNNDWASLAIAYFAQDRRRGDEAIAFLEALERQAYIIFLQAGDDNMRLARYRKPLQAILDNASTEEVVELLDITPYDKMMARHVLDGAIYKKERIRQAVLLRIDERLSGVGARYEPGEVTVEHVLPRNPPPQSDWHKCFPNAKSRRALVDRLGNLALLSKRKNSEAGNLEFDRKKVEYFVKDGVTPFAITTQILAEPVWNTEVVERRQKQLFKLACEIWKI